MPKRQVRSGQAVRLASLRQTQGAQARKRALANRNEREKYMVRDLYALKMARRCLADATAARKRGDRRMQAAWFDLAAGWYREAMNPTPL